MSETKKPFVPFNSLGLVHHFLRENVREGAVCIDATAGRGRDTVFLCGLVGSGGSVIALDIQQDAVDSTRALIEENGCSDIAKVFLDSHENIDRYAQTETVDCIVFNLGWLPGGDHNVFTKAKSSIAAIEKSLTLLKHGGILSVCIYYGRENGTGERDAVLEYLRGIDQNSYTTLVCEFANRTNCPPIPVFVIKE